MQHKATTSPLGHPLVEQDHPSYEFKMHLTMLRHAAVLHAPRSYVIDTYAAQRNKDLFDYMFKRTVNLAVAIAKRQHPWATTSNREYKALRQRFRTNLYLLFGNAIAVKNFERALDVNPFWKQHALRINDALNLAMLTHVDPLPSLPYNPTTQRANP